MQRRAIMDEHKHCTPCNPNTSKDTLSCAQRCFLAKSVRPALLRKRPGTIISCFAAVPLLVYIMISLHTVGVHFQRWQQADFVKNPLREPCLILTSDTSLFFCFLFFLFFGFTFLVLGACFPRTVSWQPCDRQRPLCSYAVM